MPPDRTGKSSIGSDARAEKNVVAQVVDTQLQVAEREREPVILKIGTAGQLGIPQSKDGDLGHWYSSRRPLQGAEIAVLSSRLARKARAQKLRRCGRRITAVTNLTNEDDLNSGLGPGEELPTAAAYRLFSRTPSNSSPFFHPTRRACPAASQPSANPKRAMAASEV